MKRFVGATAQAKSWTPCCSLQKTVGNSAEIVIAIIRHSSSSPSQKLKISGGGLQAGGCSKFQRWSTRTQSQNWASDSFRRTMWSQENSDVVLALMLPAKPPENSFHRFSQRHCFGLCCGLSQAVQSETVTPRQVGQFGEVLTSYLEGILHLSTPRP